MTEMITEVKVKEIVNKVFLQCKKDSNYTRVKKLIIQELFPDEINDVDSDFNYAISPNDGVLLRFMTVEYYLKNCSKYMDINPDYQRFPKYSPLKSESESEKNRWNDERKIEYLISLVNKLAPTALTVADYIKCKKGSNVNDSKYFEKLIKSGYEYGLLDGGHRDNLLNSIFNDILSGKDEKILNEVCSKLNISISELRERIKKSTISIRFETNRNQDQIHNLFGNLNSGVPLSKFEDINTINSELNSYFHGLKKDSKITQTLSYLNIKDATFNFSVLYYSYFMEAKGKNLKKITKEELEKFLYDEKPDPIIIKKHLFILDMINKLYSSFLTKNTSASKFLGLYMILSIIYDNKQTIKHNYHYRFMKIINGILIKYASDTRQFRNAMGNDNWNLRFRTNENFIEEKWNLFLDLYKDKSKYNFTTDTDTDLSIQHYLTMIK